MKGVWAGETKKRGASSQAVEAMRKLKGDKLRNAITATINLGAAIMFSATRDGGAVVVTVLDGDARNKVYPTTLAELEQALDDLIESFGTTAEPF